MRLTRLPICAAGLLGAGLVSAASTHARRGVECYFEIPADSGDTCESLATSWGLSVDLFTKINPGVQCPSLEAGKSYCVIGEWTPDETTSPPSPPPTTTTTTTTRSQPPTTTAPTTSPSTTPSNAPTMPGVAPDCDRFYKVRSGDQCDTIASRNGITVAQLRSWNAEINDACSNLWLDYYICVHVPGAAPPPSATTTTAPAPSNSPTMPGVAPNCDRFHKIQSGDQCDAIARTYGITVAQLRSWNTQIDAACSNLWLDYYICVHVPGAATTTSTAPAPSNSPTLPGAVSNCNRWYKIASGDTCDKIAAKNAITVDQFRSWNTQINTSCNNLLLGYYACTGVPGAATPMPDIVSSCSRYYLVASGDTCDTIVKKSGITLANFRRWNPYINAACTNLWGNALVCTNAP